MSRAASIWTGLLKAGALALVLALFGFATASAHDGHDHHTAAPAMMASHAHHAEATAVASTAAMADCAGHDRTAMSAAGDGPHAHHDHSSGDGCCQDACACGCAAACAAHLHAGLPGAAIVAQPVPAALLVPGHAHDPAGLTTPPDPRPPLFI